jgi:hypothetical protein
MTSPIYTHTHTHILFPQPIDSPAFQAESVLPCALILNFPSRCSAVLEVPVQLIFLFILPAYLICVMVGIKRLYGGGGRGDITLCVTRTGSGGKRRG